MSRSEEILKKDAQYFTQAGRVPYYPLVIDRAHGAKLWDADGQEYIDLLSSASALNMGHTSEKIVQAGKDQMDKMMHYTPAYMYHEPVADLAERLCHLAPGDFEKRAIFGLSGSDACDAMLKFARGYTGRPYAISFIGAYHGSTYGSLSLSAVSLNMHRKVGPLVPGVYHIPYPDSYRGMYGASEPNTVEEYLAPLREMLDKYVPAEEVAAIFIETVQGDGGLLQPVPGYFEALAELCEEHGILMCVDDVQQGLGRTGTWSSSEHFGFTPDLIAYGKSLGGGLPLSAVVGRAEIMESLGAPAHLFTYAANPVSCATSMAMLDLIEEENVLDEVTRKGEWVVRHMTKWQEQFDFVGDVRGLGLSIGVEIVKDQTTKERDAEAALQICHRMFERGFVLIAFAGNVLRFQPPLVITDEELKSALEALEETLAEFAAGELTSIDVDGLGW